MDYLKKDPTSTSYSALFGYIKETMNKKYGIIVVLIKEYVLFLFNNHLIYHGRLLKQSFYNNASQRSPGRSGSFKKEKSVD